MAAVHGQESQEGQLYPEHRGQLDQQMTQD